jgi:hypothetical protein
MDTWCPPALFVDSSVVPFDEESLEFLGEFWVDSFELLDESPEFLDESPDEREESPEPFDP